MLGLVIVQILSIDLKLFGYSFGLFCFVVLYWLHSYHCEVVFIC